MSRWRGFVFWFAAALLLDQTEKWRSLPVAVAFMAGAAALVWLGPRPLLALALVLLSLGDLIARAPDLPNHGNLTLYVDVVLLAALAVRSLRARRLVALDEEVFDLALPALRGGVIVCYLFAGFHKLNFDFFDAHASCAGWFADKLVQIYAGVRVARVGWLVVGLAAITVACELALAVLFAVPRGRRFALCLGWALHGLLALSVFFDFSALMLALFWTFAPVESELPRRSWSGDPLRLSLVVHGVGVICSGLVFLALGPERRMVAHVAQGVALNVAVALVAIPLARSWRRFPVAEETTPAPRRARALDVASPILLALFAAGNYLGLRTAGTFSMFSNLRTEAGQSNHALVRRPLRLGGYQDDVVWVLQIGGDLANDRGRDHGQALDGAGLPRVELEKLIWRWRHDGGGPVRARLLYRDEVLESDDLAHDPRWPVTSRTWAMRLLDFRVVQRDALSRTRNSCRW